jgi:hypothetical protein
VWFAGTKGNQEYVEGDLRNVSGQSVTNVQLRARVFEYGTGQTLAVLTGTTVFAAVLPGQLIFYNLGAFIVTTTVPYTAEVDIVSFEVSNTKQLEVSTNVLTSHPLRVVLRNDTPHRLTNVRVSIWAVNEIYAQFALPVPLPEPWDGTLIPGESITLPIYDYGNGCCIDYADLRVAAQGTISPTSSGP